MVGPNGSGKTTLLLTILGLLEPIPNTGGEVRLYGNDGFSKSDHGKIGWVPQAGSKIPNHIRITVREIVRLGTLNPRSLSVFGGSSINLRGKGGR
ncbi:MAG: hypothetical protein CM15mP105_0430 [Methanobacteriota archaeon]|nr:MAG: hypothetical protein CM15mP105_0430 [Euryarchaeota archaeon]